MPDNANDVQDALNEALSGDNAESQSATGSNPEVTDALDQVLKTEPENSPSDDTTDKSAKDDSKEAKTVPYARLSEVVKQKNEISERYKSLEDQFNNANAREQELRTRVGTLEKDSQLIDAIKNLAQDERYRKHVNVIDRALQGIEEEVETAEATGDNKAILDAEKRFDTKAAELEDLVAEQRAEGLFQEATARAKEMLATLPQEYTDEDRSVIGKLWTPRVDWSGIEEKGSSAIPDALNVSLSDVIKEYGTPRGALVAKTTKEVESRLPETKLVSDDDAIKGLMEKDWAETDKEGKAVHSEADFNQGLAELLRRTRQG